MSDFDPYLEWLEIPLNHRPVNYYKFLGLTPFSKSYPNDEEYGWTSSEGYVWIDFSHTKCVLDDGLECYIIDMIFEPVDGYLDM